MGQHEEEVPMSQEQFKKEKKLILDNKINTLNTKHNAIMKEIEKVNPKFAEHMFLRNELVEKFAEHMGGGIDILEQPMCSHCEKPATWDKDGKAYCFSCHKSTPADKVITVRQYLTEFLKGFTEEQLKLLNTIGGIEDDSVEQHQIKR